ncbi:AAA domain-containing protein [Mesobacillus maritimus]|uniref:AAA domain-containing protein n=1 Tax=Mesobacillus maritimus TaxID=1643336 RepID=UPI00203FC5BD|nr:AAA domain-containing protein [Mesobacillus maritimus]MCM3587350.1 AAA domain-containing protein [Mesobacillus maritimus]
MKQKLVQLKDRLNDLSKRNRSIRMLKLYDKWAFDISLIDKLDQKINAKTLVERVVDQKGNVVLVKANVTNKESLVLSGKLTSLYRNIKGIEEETGLYDLYVGYPFVSGSMLDGTYIRAPLFLYPVKLERERVNGTQWKLSLEEGEPQLNRTLILAFKKFSGLDIDEKIFDEAEEQAKSINFLKLISWLKEYSLNILWNNQPELEKFVDYRQDTIPEFQKGQFQLDNMAILGNYPQGNSALIKDFEDLINESENGNDLGIIAELLQAGEEYKKTESDLGDLNQEDKRTEKSEKENFFVLDTDASQEEIINEVDHNRGLVVHGPPGTGKSQVIVNLIANSIAQDKRVLLVCQKRAALDVVYQRLEVLGLSSHVALLHDEKNDRNPLYRKLHTLLEDDKKIQDYENDLTQLSNKIEEYEAKLNAIVKGLYEVQDHGYRAFDLYGLGKPISEIEVILELKEVLNSLTKDNLDEVLMKIFSYGNHYSRFGGENYPLKDRKSFAKLELKDRLTIIEILKNVIEKAKSSIEYLDKIDQDDITPEYTWLINDKLEKIYDDLNPDEKRTLQKLRLWWWTSFTGKTIVEELLNGEKFKGISSKEWPRVRESLKLLFDLSQVSEKMSNEIKTLQPYFSDELVKRFNERISKGDIPLKEFEQKHEYIIQDFEDLRNMDREYDEHLPYIKKIIDMLKDKTASNIHKQLSDEWVDIVKQSAFIHWIDNIEAKHPVLTKIGTEEIEKVREDFKDLLLKKRDLSVKVLINRLIKKLNHVKQTNNKAMKELKHQVGKKRMVWPVRKLVREFALNGLLDVMPIWLTSPETVSAIYPLKKELFDIVIFDEASQCTVENGLPAAYRGAKIVVAGDEKQLPPSNLFKGAIQEDEDDLEIDDFTESESLLNLAKRTLPEKMLQWHYRSKSEELINFSNHAYYNGSIQIAPNVEPLRTPAAIQWHKVDGLWVNQCNEVEAKAVVELLKKLLFQNPNKTVGIITFNAKQQDKIQDIIDAEVEADQEFGVLYQQIMSRDLDERVFVKNIENVQGDERDIIIFSIAYAKNKEGRVYNRFGPLGQQGGENRLNVAVTRSKEEIHIVTSIEPNELSVDSTKNDGPKFLKSYLEYSKAVSQVKKDEIEAVLSKLNQNQNTKKQDGPLQFDSPFEEQVYNALTNLGYKVDTQVGMSGYRIDQAIVHPNHPEKYILGIECDGAMYHSSPSAKERDVYRQRFLETKGWKITRIWSRNWWKNSSAEIEKIDQLVKKLMKEENIKEKVMS